MEEGKIDRIRSTKMNVSQGQASQPPRFCWFPTDPFFGQDQPLATSNFCDGESSVSFETSIQNVYRGEQAQPEGRHQVLHGSTSCLSALLQGCCSQTTPVPGFLVQIDLERLPGCQVVHEFPYLRSVELRENVRNYQHVVVMGQFLSTLRATSPAVRRIVNVNPLLAGLLHGPEYLREHCQAIACEDRLNLVAGLPQQCGPPRRAAAAAAAHSPEVAPVGSGSGSGSAQWHVMSAPPGFGASPQYPDRQMAPPPPAMPPMSFGGHSSPSQVPQTAPPPPPQAQPQSQPQHPSFFDGASSGGGRQPPPTRRPEPPSLPPPAQPIEVKAAQAPEAAAAVDAGGDGSNEAGFWQTSKSEPAAPEFASGDSVVVQNVQAVPELNNKSGVVKGWDENHGRWLVRVQGREKDSLLKPSCLKKLPTPSRVPPSSSPPPLPIAPHTPVLTTTQEVQPKQQDSGWPQKTLEKSEARATGRGGLEEKEKQREEQQQQHQDEWVSVSGWKKKHASSSSIMSPTVGGNVSSSGKSKLWKCTFSGNEGRCDVVFDDAWHARVVLRHPSFATPHGRVDIRKKGGYSGYRTTEKEREEAAKHLFLTWDKATRAHLRSLGDFEPLFDQWVQQQLQIAKGIVVGEIDQTKGMVTVWFHKTEHRDHVLKTCRPGFVTVASAEVEIGHHSKERNAVFVQRATEWSHKIIEADPLRKFLRNLLDECDGKTNSNTPSNSQPQSQPQPQPPQTQSRFQVGEVPLGKLPLGTPVALNKDWAQQRGGRYNELSVNAMGGYVSDAFRTFGKLGIPEYKRTVRLAIPFHLGNALRGSRGAVVKVLEKATCCQITFGQEHDFFCCVKVTPELDGCAIRCAHLMGHICVEITQDRGGPVPNTKSYGGVFLEGKGRMALDDSWREGFKRFRSDTNASLACAMSQASSELVRVDFSSKSADMSGITKALAMLLKRVDEFR